MAKRKQMTVAKPTVAELLKEKRAELAKRSTVIRPTSTKSRSARIVGQLDDPTEARCFIPAKVCFDLIETYVKLHKECLQPQLRDMYANMMWLAKTRPENPDIKIRNKTGMVEFEMQFIVQDYFTLGDLDVAEDQTPQDAMVELLIAKGVKPVNASKLVANELTWEITQTMSLDGEPVANDPLDEERNLARLKFVEYMLGMGVAPTPTEFGLLMIAKMTRANVKKGFLERACLYAGTLEELKVILTVIQPRALHTRAKAWDNCDSATRLNNLVNKFREMAGG
jgi:hypothetical protein